MDQGAAIDDWLARLLRSQLEGAVAPPLPAAIDAAQVEQRVAWHGLVHALAPAWEAGAGLPGEVAARLRQEAMLRGFWEEAHRAAIAPLVEQLHARGIAALLLKGTALAYALYPQPASRVRGDTDLLVRAGDLQAIRRMLAQAGGNRQPRVHGVQFQETWQLPGPGGTAHALDLHWRVSDSPVLQQLLDERAMFACALPLPRFGQHGQMAPHAEALVLLALNASWHARFGYRVDGVVVHDAPRLIWALDTHYLASAMTAADWRQAQDLGLAGGIAPLLLDLLERAQRLLAAPLDQACLAALAAAPRDSAAMRYLALTSHAARAKADFWACRGMGAKARFAAALLLPAEPHLRARFPDAANWPRWLLLARYQLGGLRRALRQ